MRDSRQAIKCLDKVDAMGYRRDLCAPMRVNLGQLFMGLVEKGPDGKPFKPDLVFQPNMCFYMPKTGQIYADHFKIPFFTLDVPHIDTEANRAYLIAQMHEAIEWLEVTTSRKYDDERLIEAACNEWDSMVLWAKICLLNQTVPAPLNFRHLWSLRLLLRTFRHKRETLDFYRILYDEVRERVRRGISAQGIEVIRLLQESLPPFYEHDLLKMADRFGAVFVGGEIPFTTNGAWMVKQDRSWVAPPMIKERNKPIATRNDALNALAELYLAYTPVIAWPGFGDRTKDWVKRVEDYKAEGVVVNLDPSCRVSSAGTEEAIVALKNKGIPVCVYECEEADPRTFNGPLIRQKLDTFYRDTLGLREIERPQSMGSDEIAN
jgi:benzoyl-CoA reductase subunit B